MDLSVIIVSYNVRNFLEQCLHSVRRAATNILCEVFVIDNNSSDGSCQMVETLFPEVGLIKNQANLGYAAANNQALKMATGRYLLLLNPDTIVNQDTFLKCIKFMDDHPDAGAAGVRMINGDGKFLPESKRALPTPGTAFFKMSGLAYLFPKSGFFNRYYLGQIDKSETSKAEVIAGAFMFLRAGAVRRTGLLDEDFFMFGEDIDYSYRLLKAGYNNYYYPETAIVHFKGESTRQENIRAVKYFYRAMSIYVRKHYSGGGMKLLAPFLHTAIFFSGSLALLKNLLRNLFR
jgi:GT2 family glycosyltransferase